MIKNEMKYEPSSRYIVTMKDILYFMSGRLVPILNTILEKLGVPSTDRKKLQRLSDAYQSDTHLDKPEETMEWVKIARELKSHFNTILDMQVPNPTKSI